MHLVMPHAQYLAERDRESLGPFVNGLLALQAERLVLLGQATNPSVKDSLRANLVESHNIIVGAVQQIAERRH